MSESIVPGADRIELRVHAPNVGGGFHFIATVACPALGAPQAYLLLAPDDDALVLAEPGGVSAQLRLTPLLAELARNLRAQH